MRKLVLPGLVALLVSAPALADWSDNFDSYNLGSINGQGGWQGWNNVAGAAGIVTNSIALSAPNSQQINGAADSVHQYAGYTSGSWVYDAKVWVPNDFQGGGSGSDLGSYFIMLSRYADNATNNVWTVQAAFNSVNHMFEGNFGSNTKYGVPYVTGQWSDIRVEIYLNQDWTKVFYNGTLLDDPNVPDNPSLGGGYQWTKGVFGADAGPLSINAVDLYANSSSNVFYDNISLTPEPTSLVLLALLFGLRRR